MSNTDMPLRTISSNPSAPAAIQGEWHARWRRFRRSRQGMAGLTIIVALYFTIFLAEFIAPYHYTTQFVDLVHAPPQLPRIPDADGWHWPFIYRYKIEITDGGLNRVYRLDTSQRYPIRFFAAGEPYRWLGLIPGRRHLVSAEGAPWLPLGGNRMGRDLFSRMIYGGRVSLTIGLFGVMISLVIGTLVGTVSGYFGGWIDGVIQRMIELLLIFPTIPLWMALAAALPSTWGQLQVYFGIVTILSLVSWGGLARQVRGLVLSLRERDYVKAARSFRSQRLLYHLPPSHSRIHRAPDRPRHAGDSRHDPG